MDNIEDIIKKIFDDNGNEGDRFNYSDPILTLYTKSGLVISTNLQTGDVDIDTEHLETGSI